MYPRTFFSIFLSCFSVAVLLHFTALCILIRIRSKPINQWKILVHMAITEFTVSILQIILASNKMTKHTPKDTKLYVEIYFRAWFSLMYIVLMTYLAIDRTLAISLHLRYKAIFTQRRVTIILTVLWTTCAVLAAFFVTMTRFLWGWASAHLYAMCFFFSADVLFLIVAIATYVYLFMKVRQISKKDKTNQLNQARRRVIQKFLMPCALIATYLLFGVTSSFIFMLAHYKYIPMRVAMEGGNLLMACGIISDGLIYICLQKDIRHYITRKLGFKQADAQSMTSRGKAYIISVRTMGSLIHNNRNRTEVTFHS